MTEESFSSITKIFRRIASLKLDAEKINEDPDKYIETHLKDTKLLEKMINISAYLYHNFDGGGLTDNSFDALEYYLNKRLKAKSRKYDRAAYLPWVRVSPEVTPADSGSETPPAATSADPFK